MTTREPHPYVRFADTLREKLSNELRTNVNLWAENRLRMATQTFQVRFPKRRLQILFGNGHELVTIDEKYLIGFDGVERDGMVQLITDQYTCLWRRTRLLDLKFLAYAIADVIEITDDYTDGCPSDIDIQPRRKR
jgi:hypothetical protein